MGASHSSAGRRAAWGAGSPAVLPPAVPPTDPFGNKVTGADGQPPATAPAPLKPADQNPAAAPAKEPVKPQPRLFTSPDAGGAAPAKSDTKPAGGVKPDPFIDDTSPAKPAAPGDTKPKDSGSTKPSTDDTKPKTESPAATTPKGPASLPLDTRLPEVEQLPGQAEFKAGQDLLTAGKYTEAIEQFRKSLKLAPDEAATHLSLGVCYRMLNRLDDAIDEFSEAIRLAPELSDAYLRRGICCYYKGEYGMAIVDCDDAAAISLSDPHPFTWKGMALVKQGKLIDAVNTYSLALRSDNRFGLAHVNRGLTYYALKDYGARSAISRRPFCSPRAMPRCTSNAA